MKRKATLEDYGFAASKRLKTPCKISDLPNEMLREVFKHLSINDRLIARRVSSFWMELMNEYFQDDNTLRLANYWDFSPTGSLYKTFQARLSSTKAKRVFSRFSIVWCSKDKFIDFVNFIKLIGDEIRFLRISYSSTIESINDLYVNLPNLESLEVCEEALPDVSAFPCNLKSIKITSQFTQLEKLPDIQKFASLEHFSTKSLVIKQNTDALAPFLDPKLKTLLDSILGDDVHGSNMIKLDTAFNFCGEAKLIADDITEVRIENKILNVAPLTDFNNLKRLEFYMKNQPVIHFASLNEGIQFPSVEKLQISGKKFSNGMLTDIPILLRKFFNLTSLTIGWNVTVQDFRTICEHMPKLEHLRFSASRISINTLFDRNNFSLKDLKLLESLSVQTKPEILFSAQLTWPSLPYLMIVDLKGEGFRYLDESFYAQMAQNSPNIKEFEIYYNRNSVENEPSKFFPLLQSLNLKVLSLPGEGANNSINNNNVLIEYVIAHCKKLEHFKIFDDNEISLAQEIRLFRSLSKLETIASESMDTETLFRVIERWEFRNLKKYLAETIHVYKDVPGTIAYLYDNEIPHSKRIQMEKDFEAKHKGHSMKKWYIVLHDYLKMSFLDVCCILKYFTTK
ncbi:uncharacterized protein LOC134831986 [Culicoides brevitarsis]|uniref:uncharacterized protein LOC134831986 n=1 Tax=Culicoides brevitarsis TaxID=469753 RepID=UPI00307B40E7